MHELSRRHGFRMVPEHLDFAPSLLALARSPWPNEIDGMLARQREFLRVEASRSRLAASWASRGVVMDRTIFSPIGHLYARTIHRRDGGAIVRRFLADCASELARGAIVLPESLCFLRRRPRAIAARAMHSTRSRDTRSTEPFLLRRDVMHVLDATTNACLRGFHSIASGAKKISAMEPWSPTPSVRAVEFQTATACNARCTICPWPDVRGANLVKRMPDAIWRRLLDDLTELRPARVIPYLNNEPLIDPTLTQRIVTLRACLPAAEIEVSTNGFLLSESAARELLEAGTTDLFVSVFGYDHESQRRLMGTDFDRVRANVLSAVGVCRALGLPARIRVVQVELPGVPTERLDAARQRWRDDGVEVLRYGYLDRAGNVDVSVAGAPQRDATLTPRGCELDRHRERMYVLTDGTVIFCCHDWRVEQPVGHLLTSTLREIWHSDAYRDLRDRVDGRLPSEADFLCRRCKLCGTGRSS